MKILYSSDLHGEMRLYQELVEFAVASSPDLIVLGGDLLPSFPPTKRYEDMVPNQKAFTREFLTPLLKRMVETTSSKRVFLIAGNWDLGYDYLFRNPVEGVIDLNQGIFRLENGYEMIGYPFVPPTPFRPKDFEKMDDTEAAWPPQKNPSYTLSADQTDQLTAIDPYLHLRQKDTILQDLSRLPKPLSYKKAIYVMHSPPFGTRLDCIQGGKSAGSRSMRAFIQENQPLLTLHGHIHESPQLSGNYLDRIGETISLNPGQFTQTGRGFSRLHAVTFEAGNLEATLVHTCFPRQP